MIGLARRIKGNRLYRLSLSRGEVRPQQEVVHNTGEDLVCATSGMRRQRMGTGSTCPFNRATAEGFAPTYRQCVYLQLICVFQLD